MEGKLVAMLMAAIAIIYGFFRIEKSKRQRAELDSILKERQKEFAKHKKNINRSSKSIKDAKEKYEKAKQNLTSTDTDSPKPPAA